MTSGGLHVGSDCCLFTQYFDPFSALISVENDTLTLSPIGRIKILTYLIWGFLGAAILDCIIRSCDLFYWFIRTCLGPTVVLAAITSLEVFCVLTMCYFSDNVSSKKNIRISWLIFMFYYGDIIAIKNSYCFFSFT